MAEGGGGSEYSDKEAACVRRPGELLKDSSKAVFLSEARKLVPGLRNDMVEPSFVGVMAQVFLPDGSPAKDYIFERRCLGGTTMHPPRPTRCWRQAWRRDGARSDAG
eukprot:gene2823-11824_t